MPKTENEIRKVSALSAHTFPSQRPALFLQLIAHWTRQLNLQSKGKPCVFTEAEIKTILAELEQKLAESRNV